MDDNMGDVGMAERLFTVYSTHFKHETVSLHNSLAIHF
jgi:hypothetical protein